MREIGEAFAARLAADGTTLCACWRFERRDGKVFGATDHDVAITFDDVTFEPASGLRSATFGSSAGLAPGRASAEGAISAEFISEEDLRAGLWNGASVDVWRVDWTAPEHRLRIWSGRLSEVTLKGSAFAAELVSLKADLERSIGRVYSRTCDAEVGDARCGLTLTAPAFSGEGRVVEVVGKKPLVVDGLGGFGDGWFSGGVLTWTAGDNTGVRSRVLWHGDEVIELAVAPMRAIQADDWFTVSAGCDKSFAMCGAKFGNRDNFRGFPHMPGTDAILAGPATDRANTGGRRR